MLSSLLDATRDLVRIGYHSVNLVHLMTYNQFKGVLFSPAAIKEVNQLYSNTHRMVLDALKVIIDNDTVLAGEVVERHRELAQSARQIRKNHIQRINIGECTPLAGINFRLFVNCSG